MERKWWTLLVVCVATFMLLLDITIVNVALPTIARDLKANFSDLQWVVDSYALTLAAVLLTAGALADLFGRRLVFALGGRGVLCRLAGLRPGAKRPVFESRPRRRGDWRGHDVRHRPGAPGPGVPRP